MEGVAAEITDGAKRTALVAAHDALRRILHDLEAMAVRDLHDRVHLAGNTGVVHRHDGLCPVGDGLFDLRLINVHRVGADVHKHQPGPRQHGRGCRAGEGIAGQNDLIAGLQVTQQHGHIQRRGAAGGQQHLLGMEALLQPCVALLGKGTVTADLVGCNGLLYIFDFFTHAGGHIKRDHKNPSFTA